MTRGYVFRKFKDRLVLGLGGLAVILALVPLGSILIEVVVRGLPAINWQFLTAESAAGGLANSIQGTLILIALSCVLGVPLGVASGIYLAEYGNSRLGDAIRFLTDVLAGVPSIVAGIFAFLIVFLVLRYSFSAIGAAIALSVLMLPVVARTTEESLKLVPNSIREGAMALGVRRWRTTLSVVLIEAKGGIITGILLAIARIAGETAPLILTILGSDYFFYSFNAPMDALSLKIYGYATQSYQQYVQQGWGASLFLIMMVLALSIGVRVVTRGKYQSLR